MDAVATQIRNVLGEHRRIVVKSFTRQNPSHVGPECALARRVRVAFAIGFLVVNSMGCNPEDWPTFQCQRAANGKEILKKQRGRVRAMCVQPMVAHADTQASSHPIQKDRKGTSTPTEREEGGYGANVKERKDQTIRPVYSRIGGYNTFAVHEPLFKLTSPAAHSLYAFCNRSSNGALCLQEIQVKGSDVAIPL